MIFFPHNFPEFYQNFGISVPVKMHNKKKNWYLFIFFIHLLSIKSVICHFSFLVLKELKNTHKYQCAKHTVFGNKRTLRKNV